MKTAEVYKYICSPVTLFAAVVLSLAMILGCMNVQSNDLLYLYEYSISLGYTNLILPITTVLPFCYLYQREAATGYGYFVLTRGSVLEYVLGKILAAISSGLFVSMIALTVFFVYCSFFNAQGVPHVEQELFSGGKLYVSLMEREQYILVLIIMVCALLFNGMLWPMISLCAYAFTYNRYIVVAAPFVARMLLGYIMQSLKLYLLDPAQLLLKGFARNTPGGGLLYILLYTCCVIALCSFIWGMRLRRRIRYG